MDCQDIINKSQFKKVFYICFYINIEQEPGGGGSMFSRIYRLTFSHSNSPFTGQSGQKGTVGSFVSVSIDVRSVKQRYMFVLHLQRYLMPLMAENQREKKLGVGIIHFSAPVGNLAGMK